eukprot:TCALIF_11208-PA protein Name:"Similar to Caspase-1 (Spodoptera frugiperda)" AED:0.30 eAED:0.30 QI:0/-1/0/1/-1/1/1/0/343
MDDTIARQIETKVEVTTPIVTNNLQHAEAYNLTGEKRIIIFNHATFSENKMRRRNGTEKDRDQLTETYESLGFSVKTYEDPTRQEIDNVMRLLKELKVKLACLIIAILTHGQLEDGQWTIHSHDKTYNLDTVIVDPLLPRNCSALAGQPKIILVQACQGEDTDAGTPLKTSTDGPQTHFPKTTNYTIANYSDFLLAYSSYKGHFSFRNNNGSWFIQDLCKAIHESRDGEAFHSILLRMKRYVSTERASNADQPELDNKRQIPVVTDTLIRQIYLKGEPASQNIQAITTQIERTITEPVAEMEVVELAGMPEDDDHDDPLKRSDQKRKSLPKRLGKAMKNMFKS